MENLIEVGIITKPHGINGQLKIKSLAFGNFDFLKAKVLFIDKIPYEIENLFFNKQEVVVKFKEITNIEDALKLKNKSVFSTRNNCNIEDGFFWSDLIGCSVFVDEINVGKIYDIQNFGSADVIYVSGKKPFLFSNKGGIIENVDLLKNIVYLNKTTLQEVIVYED